LGAADAAGRGAREAAFRYDRPPARGCRSALVRAGPVHGPAAAGARYAAPPPPP